MTKKFWHSDRKAASKWRGVAITVAGPYCDIDTGARIVPMP
jgi:hypothetical protein